MPLFVIALQLPQGAVLYWAASSSFALLQVRQGATMHITGHASHTRGLDMLPLTSRPLTDWSRLLLQVNRIQAACCLIWQSVIPRQHPCRPVLDQWLIRHLVCVLDQWLASKKQSGECNAEGPTYAGRNQRHT